VLRWQNGDPRFAFVEEAGILAERVRSTGGHGHGVVGAEGLEPPTYAL
jgi:hypothetical protein